MSGLKKLLTEYERTLLVGALEASGGDRAQAAQTLEVSPKNLWKKLHKHGLLDNGASAPKGCSRPECWRYRVLVGLLRAYLSSTVTAERDALAAAMVRELEFIEALEGVD